MPPTEPRITITDLTMAYGSFVIQHDLNFSIPPGAIFIIIWQLRQEYAAAPSHSALMPPAGEVRYGESFWAAPRRTASG